MKIARVLLVSLLVGLWWHGVADAAAPGSPTEQVKETVDKVIETLKNKELKKPSKAEERRAILRRTVGDRFDFEEMSKRTLSIHWQKRTPEERKEFVSLFSDLLERTYVNKIESYTDEKVVYGDESIEGDYAVVKTKIITSANVEVPIDY
jgi:phospholipid transport system substrate-binding protein